jgi:hypothetical protein
MLLRLEQFAGEAPSLFGFLVVGDDDGPRLRQCRRRCREGASNKQKLETCPSG